MSNSLQNLTASQLKRALALRVKIDSLQRQLTAITGDAGSPAPAAPKKRKMSAAGRAAISRAAKLRWAKERAAKKAAK